MTIPRVLGSLLAVMLVAAQAGAAASEVADAAMKGNRDAVRAALARKADVNAPQIDGTTALHWAVRADDREMADLLIRAGAKRQRPQPRRHDADAAGGRQRQRRDDRAAHQGRRRSECAAAPSTETRR